MMSNVGIWPKPSASIPTPPIRFYGPEEAFYNKSFKLQDVELVKY